MTSRLKPRRSDPAQVHAQQHLGPVLRLGAARAGMDRHDRVLAIVLAAEHLLGLAGVDLRRQVVERAGEVVGDRLPCLGPFDQDGEILGAAPQRIAEIAILLEAPAALQQLLRRRLVLPEVRIGDARLDCREFFGGLGGVKDSSAGRWRGAPDRHACEAVRPVVRP